MLSKEEIKNIVRSDNSHIYEALQNNLESSDLLSLLESLGHLDRSFDFSIFIKLLNHTNPNIRFWAVKNLGKGKNILLLREFINIYNNDPSSIVRREAVSSIGRMRNRQTIQELIKILNDDDPKIVLQAIRGLLIFKGTKEIDNELSKLVHHPNELIQQVITKEYFSKSNSINAGLHTKFPQYLRNTIVHGDVREILKYVPEESIHLTFTSPPYYNARDYSIYKSYSAYLSFLEEVFTEIHRITKEGRFLIVNTSPIIIPRISRAHSSKRYPIPFDLHSRIVNNGWEFIDDIIWVKPESSVKNRNAGFLMHRKPLAYKPNAISEYLMVYRKSTDKLLDWNIHQYSDEIVNQSRVNSDYETSNVWYIDPKFDKVHSAVFPLELCERVIKYYSYIGDLVFDPFGGSGTMGKAAIKLKRNFFMTEIENTYIQRIKEILGYDELINLNNINFYDICEFKKIGDNQL